MTSLIEQSQLLLEKNFSPCKAGGHHGYKVITYLIVARAASTLLQAYSSITLVRKVIAQETLARAWILENSALEAWVGSTVSF